MTKQRRKPAPATVPTAAACADPIDALVQWLTRSGARCSGFGVRPDINGERGAFAPKAVRSGDVLLSIPSRAMIPCSLARNSEIGRKISASGVTLRSEQTWLAAFLLQEKLRPDSFFRPYLDALPLAFPHVPLFFDDDELSELKGSLTRFLIQHRRASIAEEYRNLCDSVDGFSRFTPQQFVWARVVVVTRTFGFSMAGKGTEGLVPLADMLNHHPTRETRWSYDSKKKRFQVTSLRDFTPGEAIHGHYGAKCNSRLFVNYGFALEDNADNEAEFVVTIPQDDPLRESKLALLGIPGGARRFQLPATLQGKGAGDLRSFLRVACANSQELSQISGEMAAIGKVSPLGESLEMRASGLLADALGRALAGFDTTVAQDDARLEDPGLPANIRTCIIVRRGEKRVLERLSQLCSRGLQARALPGEP